MKRILVPTDYSDLSINSLDFAIDLAKDTEAEVDLVFFMKTPIEAATFREQLGDGDEAKAEFFDSERIREHERKLNEIVEPKKSEGVPLNVAVGGSGVVSGSDKYVRAHSVDLIVIGADEEEKTKGDFPISVSQELTQHVKIPVISLTEHVDYADMTRVVLALDVLDEKYTLKAIPIISAISDSFGAKFYLLNLLKSGETKKAEVEAKLDAFAKAAEISEYEVAAVEHMDELQGIMSYSAEIGAGLIATISDGRPGIFRFFKDSFATEIVKATDIPVMVLNKKNL
jgi:nucleotide-binding universal stress UspA family protein